MDKRARKKRTPAHGFKRRSPSEEFFGISLLRWNVQVREGKKKRPKSGTLKPGLLIATDTLKKKPLVGALVSGEDEAETSFLLKELKTWLPKQVMFMTIDFSARLEAGVKEVYPNVILQKCVFHAIQLLTRGLRKEFTRRKQEILLDHIKEWNMLRGYTLSLEKGEHPPEMAPFKYDDVELAKKIFNCIRKCLSGENPTQIEQDLSCFFSTSLFNTWEGKDTFISRYNDIFTKKNLTFSTKGITYVVPQIHKAFRAVIREIRKELEESKIHFNKVKYLVLMNPINMKPYQVAKLRKYLKEFPWLRSYRQVLVKFYYQFRVPSEKRASLLFLSQLITDTSHPWLKSAVQTLIDNEENVFRFQRVPELFPKVKFSKFIKVVNESCNKIMNQLYHTQCGMRTLENIRMRVSNRLQCPIIVSPTLLEKIK